MATVLKVQHFNIETGEQIPMSQNEEDKQKKKWYNKLYGWLLGGGAFIVVGVFYGFGTGGGPFGIQKVVITSVGRPGTNK